jgi:hypothetical protein
VFSCGGRCAHARCDESSLSFLYFHSSNAQARMYTYKDVARTVGITAGLVGVGGGYVSRHTILDGAARG